MNREKEVRRHNHKCNIGIFLLPSLNIKKALEQLCSNSHISMLFFKAFYDLMLTVKKNMTKWYIKIPTDHLNTMTLMMRSWCTEAKRRSFRTTRCIRGTPYIWIVEYCVKTIDSRRQNGKCGVQSSCFDKPGAGHLYP